MTNINSYSIQSYTYNVSLHMHGLQNEDMLKRLKQSSRGSRADRVCIAKTWDRPVLVEVGVEKEAAEIICKVNKPGWVENRKWRIRSRARQMNRQTGRQWSRLGQQWGQRQEVLGP